MERPDGFRIAEIMAKKAVGDITSAEQDELDLWLNASQSNRKSYARFMSGETRSRRDSGLAEHDTEKSLGEITRRIRARRIRIALVRTSSAAILVAGILSVAHYDRLRTEEIHTSAPTERHSAIMSFDDGKTVLLKDMAGETEWLAVVEAGKTASRPDEVPGSIRIEVPRGNTYKLRLNDGTAVWLNSETVIEYPEWFTDGVRDIRLSGEAFFDVSRDPSRPFVITTQDGVEISVIGTRFNVHSYNDDDRIHVTLAEGSVEVNAGVNRSLLKPCEQAVFDRHTGTLEVSEVNNMRLWTAWTDGEFYLEDTIGNIFSAMEKWYGIDIIYEGAPDATAGRFIVKAGNSDNFTVVLNALQKITGMSYRTEGRKVFVVFPA